MPGREKCRNGIWEGGERVEEKRGGEGKKEEKWESERWEEKKMVFPEES